MTEPVFCSVGTLAVDEILEPDGKVTERRAGGGSGHGAMGMRLWEDRTGILTRLGFDFDPEEFPFLEDFFLADGFSRTPDLALPRLQLIMNQDGSREETFNIPFERLHETVPEPSEIPQDWARISGVHLHCYPNHLPEWVDALRTRDCQAIVWEPWSQFALADNRDQFLELGRLPDIVSPNIFEARILSGLQDPLEICTAWHRAGLRRVILRLGAEGCLAMDADGNHAWLPAYPVAVVDQTGAGNACCGGAAVGFARTGDLFTATAYGNVSASFTLEQYGAFYDLHGKRAAAEKRLEWYKT